MALTAASTNALSTQVLGTIPAIFRDDNASYYSVGALANTVAETIVDLNVASIPDKTWLLVTCDDATWGRSAALFLISAGVLYEVWDVANKFAGTDAGTFIRFFVGSSGTAGDLIISNNTGAALAADAIRIYRLA